MISLSDPEDHALLISDMTQQLNELKREQHISEIKKLAQRKHELRTLTVQKRVIKLLEKQLEETQVEVNNLYSPQNEIKDNESKGYLNYLLEMYDYYNKHAEKLKDKLKEKDTAIRDIYRKVCSKQREHAKVLRSKIRQIPKSKTVDIYESRIERAYYEIGRMTTKNRELRKNIQHMFIVRANYFKVYQQLIKTNDHDKRIITKHLEDSVTAYRSREELVYKTSILKERLLADIQKAMANNVLLHRIKEREAKAAAFEAVKQKERPDCRASKMEELVRKGVTGLEPEVEAAKTMHVTIMDASGTEDIPELKDKFQKAEKDNINFFFYISNLHEEIDGFTIQLRLLRRSIDAIAKSLSEGQKRCSREIAAQKEKVEELQMEVDQIEQKKQAFVIDLQNSLHSVHEVITPSLTSEVEAEDVESEEYVWDTLAFFESEIADLLTAFEYLNYLDVGEQEEQDRRKFSEGDIEFDGQGSLEMAAPTTAVVIDECAPRQFTDVAPKDTDEQVFSRTDFSTKASAETSEDELESDSHPTESENTSI